MRGDSQVPSVAAGRGLVVGVDGPARRRSRALPTKKRGAASSTGPLGLLRFMVVVEDVRGI